METSLYLEARSLGLAMDSALGFFILLLLAGLFSIPSLNSYFQQEPYKLVQILTGLFALVLFLGALLALKDIIPWLVNKDPIIESQSQDLRLMQDPGKIQTYPIKSLKEVNWYKEEERSTEDLTSTYYNSYIEFIIEGQEKPIYLSIDLFKKDPSQVKEEIGTYFSSFPHIEMHQVTKNLGKDPSYRPY